MDDARPDVPETRGRWFGRWALAIFYAAAGVAHFLYTDAMVRIVPSWVPWDAREVVLTTGAAELICVAALMTRKWRLAAGWALALYALCVWPANVKHAMIDLAWLGGSGAGLSAWYHVPRLLAQPLLIAWALWAVGAVRGTERGGGGKLTVLTKLTLLGCCMRKLTSFERCSRASGGRGGEAYMDCPAGVRDLSDMPDWRL